MRRLLAGSALLLSVTLVLAACGDDDDDTSSAASGTTAAAGAATETSAAPTTTAAAAGGATTTGAASGGYDYGGGSATDTTAAASGSATTAAAAAGGGQLALADTSAGKVLVNAEGMTLYLFTPDDQSAPTCYDSCAQTWPHVDAAAGVGAGLDASKLGSATRTDGGSQATYNGWPLYTFAGDTKAGDVNGIGIGGNWFAVDAAGEQVAT